MSNVANLIQLLGSTKGAKFGSFIYKNAEGEVSRVTLILGASTEVLYNKDIAILEEMLKQDSSPLHKVCMRELLNSRKESLELGIGQNTDYTLKDLYVYPQGLEHVGIRVHKDNGSIQVNGLAEHKTILIPGIYKPVNKRPKTVIKDQIRKLLPSNRFRTYRLDRVGTAKMNGETLEIENLIET